MNEPLVFTKQSPRTYKMGDVFVYDGLTFYKPADPKNPNVDDRLPLGFPDYWKFNELIRKVIGDKFNFDMTNMVDDKLIFEGPPRYTREGVITYVRRVRGTIFNHMTEDDKPNTIYKEASPTLKPSIASIEPIKDLSD